MKSINIHSFTIIGNGNSVYMLLALAIGTLIKTNINIIGLSFDAVIDNFS